MSVTVKQINELCLRNKDLDTLIKEQLQMIDDKLLHSDRSIGNNCISHTLPTTMPSIIGIDRQDAQRIIYSTIICSLEKRGFTVRLYIDESTALMYISWKSEMDTDSTNTMNKIIRTKMVSKNEIHDLLYKKK